MRRARHPTAYSYTVQFCFTDRERTRNDRETGSKVSDIEPLAAGEDPGLPPTADRQVILDSVGMFCNSEAVNVGW
jgi:hypothetical protein